MARGAPPPARPELFGRILGRWQATRPLAMRRIAAEAQHEPPCLDDLFGLGSSPAGAPGVLGDLTVLDVASMTYQQRNALNELWDHFSGLTTIQSASCVGITKAVLPLTDERIGPALDSQVRTALGIDPPKTAAAWIGVLEGVGEDIAEVVDRIGSTIARFMDGPGTPGTGAQSGGSYPAIGGVKYVAGQDGTASKVTCLLPFEDEALCTAIVDDWLGK